MFNWKNKNPQPPQGGQNNPPGGPVPPQRPPQQQPQNQNRNSPGGRPPPSATHRLNPNANQKAEQQQKPRSVSGVALYFDDTLIRCVKPEGKVEVLYWRDLAGVFIMVSDKGSFASDLHWIMAGKEQGGCVFPNTAAGAAEIIRYMQDNLKGFNNSEVIKAMECREDKKFMIWKA